MNVHLNSAGLPFNMDTEQSVLGAILLNNEAYHYVSPILTADHFYDPFHAFLYTTFAELLDDNRPATVATLKPLLAKHELDVSLTADEYVARLVSVGAPVSMVKGCANEIIEVWARRELAIALQEGADVCSTTLTPSTRIIDDLSERLQMVREVSHRGPDTRFLLDSAADLAIDYAQERMASGGALAGMTTGLSDLDRATGGLHKRELVVIGGRPSMGKTAIGVSMLIRSAMAGHGVLFFSLEMDSDRLSERCLSDIALEDRRVEYENIRNGTLTDADLDALRRARDRLQGIPFMIEHKPALNMVQISGITKQVKTRMAKQGQSLDIVCIDHMDKMKASGYWRGNAVQEAGEKSNGLTVLAKDLDVCVVALKQLSRGPEGRDDKRPHLGDLRQSGDVEQDADVVIFPFREAYYLEKENPTDPGDMADQEAAIRTCRNVLEMHIAKNRSGRTGPLRMFCDIGCSAVRNMEFNR